MEGSRPGSLLPPAWCAAFQCPAPLGLAVVADTALEAPLPATSAGAEFLAVLGVLSLVQ